MARRKWGQHFLRDEAIARRLVQGAGVRAGETVLEVGPGRGMLTRALLEVAGRVIAVEIDPSLAAALPGRVETPERLEVLQADAANADFGAILDERLPAGEKARAVGSLPYESATPILLALLSAASRLHGIATVVQREVAERIASLPGRKTYGYLSVACQDVAHARIVQRLAPASFRPPPEVHSALVVLGPRQTPLRGDLPMETFRRFVGALFERRRKTIANNLRAATGLDRAAAEAMLQAAGVSPQARPEELEVERFAALLRSLPSANRL